MHELSVISQVVESVKSELCGKPVVRVRSVRLEIGELTMLGREQLKFAWGILTEEGPLKGSRLIIVKKPAVIECHKCGYTGGANHPTGLGSHMMVPYIACPKCGGEVGIIGGRDCLIRSMKAVVKEKNEGARRMAHGARKKGPGGKKRADSGKRSSPSAVRPAPCALLEP